MKVRALNIAYRRIGTAVDMLAVAVMLTWLALAVGQGGSPSIQPEGRGGARLDTSRERAPLSRYFPPSDAIQPHTRSKSPSASSMTHAGAYITSFTMTSTPPSQPRPETAIVCVILESV